MFLALLTVLSLFLFIFEVFYLVTVNFDKYSIPWLEAAITVNSVFLVDLVIHLIVYGFKRLYKLK